MLLERHEGKRLNSPNDVVVKSDGSIWFTDPPFGILGHYEGHKAESEVPQAVYRIDGASGEATVVADDVLGPNGLCFSPDERLLYVVESRGQPNRKILAFDVAEGGRTIANKRVLIDAGPRGTPGRHALRRRRQPLVRLGHGRRRRSTASWSSPPTAPRSAASRLPERCANVCFGGSQAQPPVHGRRPVPLRPLRQHPRRPRRVGRGLLPELRILGVSRGDLP